ncbi:MAG: hypothetical protein RIR62_822 [Pseudomonadota bacterium]
MAKTTASARKTPAPKPAAKPEPAVATADAVPAPPAAAPPEGPPVRARRERLKARALAAAEAAARRARDWVPPGGDGPDDPRGAPQMTGGWSERVEAVEGAVVVPTSGRGTVQMGGIFDAVGAYVHAGAHWRRGRPLLLPPEAGPRPRDELAGNWLWGGLLLNHFGHFLTESTPRLWALREVAGLDGLVFLHKRNAEVTAFHRNFLHLMGCDLPVHVVSRATRVERLHVPGQGFGLGRISFGTAKFRDFFRTAFARDIAPEGPERLYVSRSALGPRKGGVLGETFLEDHLVAEGYEIFHPQHHPLEVQIARYRAARQIVALDGSALHLAAFACAPHQKVAMIRRRSSSMSNAIAIHLKSFSGSDPDVIDAIRADWVLAERGRVDRFSMGELDLPAVQAALVARGYVGAGKGWPALDPVWRDGQLVRLRAEFGKDYVPLPRGAGAAAEAADDDSTGEGE